MRNNDLTGKKFGRLTVINVMKIEYNQAGNIKPVGCVNVIAEIQI